MVTWYPLLLVPALYSHLCIFNQPVNGEQKSVHFFVQKMYTYTGLVSQKQILNQLYFYSAHFLCSWRFTKNILNVFHKFKNPKTGSPFDLMLDLIRKGMFHV